MSKHNYKKSRLKYVFLAFTCATAFAFSGLAAACDNGKTDDKEKDKTTTKEDTQLLKNGNFEFFTIPEKKEDGNEPEYLIKTPENWSHGGTTSYTMSGIISTSKTAWDKITAETLADDLDYNNKLDSSSSNYLSEYVDYNGMKSSDLLYANQFNALKSDEDLEEGEERDLTFIKNPETHYGVAVRDGKLCTADGQEVFENDKGEYFLEYNKEKDEYSKPISNVLMLHNYATAHNGIAQNYSSVNIELPANTAAEISVWVKTSNLLFKQGNEVKQDRGANITVTQTVGSSTLDKFMISCINTEKLLNTDKVIEDKYNGWVEYTIYVNACDFAASTISLQLGLGETGYTTEGYAFFDDVSVTKFISLDDENCSYSEPGDVVTSNLSTDASEKVYKADSYIRNGGDVTDARYSKNFRYCIDLASEHIEDNNDTYTAVSFSDRTIVSNLKAGYTVDKDNYVSSKDDITKVNKIGFTSLTAADDKCRLPFKNSLKTSSDLLAYVTTNDAPIKADYEYSAKLNEALKSAVNLPKNSGAKDNMLVMLSAYGAAYTTSFDLDVDREGYKIVSFWVKTSDMGGSTAATVKITQTGNDDNTAQFTLDTTGKTTNIGDKENEKDIFDGWVQCFFFVKNELKADNEDTSDKFTVELSFGNTTIKGTEVHSYKTGWVALANMQTLNVDEKIFSYTGSGDSTATLTITEEAEKKTHVFDEAYANQSHEIKDDMVIGSTYTGVNGGSSAIVNNGHVSIPFDEFNNNTDDNGNKFTGLIAKEHFVNGEYKNKDWYNNLLTSFNASSTDALAAWNEIFGKTSVQPLIINNRMRTSYVEFKGADENTYENYYIKDEKTGAFTLVKDITPKPEFDEEETYYSLKQVRNYGYIGENTEIAADQYKTITVRVKVSANAIARVYLVDTSAGKKVLSFGAPSYSFYYDVDGNVLKGEPKKNATITEQRENVLYSLRDDGLYEDKEGNLYANTWNYKKLYYVEDMTYYDAEGNSYSIDDLIDGVTYYDADKKEAPHYLVTSDNVKIYEYKDGNYHYIVDGKTQSEVVNPFNKVFARYNYEDVNEDYMVEINGADHANEWVTVTFVVHAGSEAKSYRLELWSGNREEAISSDNKENGIVIFDYNYDDVTSDDLRNYYENSIILAYQKALANVDGALDGIDTTGKNIKFYEDLAKKHNVTISNDYKAHYYTFSLFDSADFKPFNKNVAGEGATGYDYNVADQNETLAYLSITEDNNYTIFTDYSAIEKSVTLNDATEDDGDDDTADDDNGSDGSIWLLASSIILVIALIFAIIAIFLKDTLKKARRNKVTSKNNYDQRKANRYKRKLHLKQEEFVEVDKNEKTEDATATEEAPEAQAEEVTEEEAPTEDIPEADTTVPDEEEKSEGNDGQE